MPEPADHPRPGGRAPGLREVLAIAALVLLAVLAVEVASSLVPALGTLFRSFPTTIVILVAGTVALLLLLAVRRPHS